MGSPLIYPDKNLDCIINKIIISNSDCLYSISKKKNQNQFSFKIYLNREWSLFKLFSSQTFTA